VASWILTSNNYSDINHALVPRDYSSGGAVISLTGDVLYLKLSGNAADGSPNVWIFVVVGGALSTAASSKMYFVKHDAAEVVEGPYTDVVSWEVAATITIGADSEMIGTMTALHGAIISGTNAKISNLNAPNRAINLGA
jgi:hypothetical protein